MVLSCIEEKSKLLAKLGCGGEPRKLKGGICPLRHFAITLVEKLLYPHFFLSGLGKQFLSGCITFFNVYLYHRGGGQSSIIL